MLSTELKNVFEELIPVYEKALEEITIDNWTRYLWDEHLWGGICLASCQRLKIVIGDEMKTLTDKFVPGTFYWYETPNHIHSFIGDKQKEYYEVRDCLQWRVDKMKEMLNQ